MIGKRIAHYEVLDELGVGGMGVVYRGRDTRLDRKVAIKALPEEFASEPERVARFEREAKLLASLNNSHVATVHGLERVEDELFLVMELIEGGSLADRLSKGGLAVPKALELARQIAEGLEAAHQADVVHRDLKPANIMVGEDGNAKVLDFGLAKTLGTGEPAEDLDESPTLTQPMTRVGQIMGTPVYMSPEQAEGEEAGKQSDIWAFGCVLYEVLTGERAFPGGTVGDAEPDYGLLPRKTPAQARSLLRRCLEKEPRQRLHDIADARIELEEALAAPPKASTTASSTAALSGGNRASAWLLLLAAVVGMLAAWTTWRFLAGPETARDDVLRMSLGLPPGVSMRASRLRPAVAISPDGRWLVFVGTEGSTRKLFKRSLDKFETTAIPDTENAGFVFFSPDSRWVGFWEPTRDRFKKVEIDGGRTVDLCGAPNAWGASWGTNGKIVYPKGDLTGLWQVSDAGGKPEPLLAPDPEVGETAIIMPEFLPDGKAVLYTAWMGGFTAASAQVRILDLESGKSELLLENAASARYLPSGHLIFGRGGRVEVVPFDLERRKVAGRSVPVHEPIFWDPEGKLHLAVSETGTVVFVPGGRPPRRRLMTSDLRGNTEVVAGSPRGYEYVRFAPDGKRLATVISEGGEPSIWIINRTTGVPTRLAGEGRRNLPLWSPDGASVAFAVETPEPLASWSIFHQQPDASGAPEPLLKAREPGEWLWPLSWTPDGKVLVFQRWVPGSSKDIFYLSIDGAAEPQPFLATEADEINGLLSPDGHWIAYASNEGGQWGIYVQGFPEGGKRHQVSGLDTRVLVGWAPDGRTLYYVFRGRMMEVGITTTPSFQAETPRALFDADYSGGDWYVPDLHLSADGERFLMIAPDETWGVANEIKIALNWLQELEELAPH